MASDPFWVHVEDVLHLVKQHSERHKRPKQAVTRLGRLSGWASVVGGVIFVSGEIVRQVGDPKTPHLLIVYLSLSILGLAIFMAGVIADIVETVRKSRRPLVEHVDRVLEALGREYEFITALDRFDGAILETARKRLQLESTKVSSRLAVIGGGDGLRTSLVGVAMLAAALISQYEVVVDGWTIKSLAFFGVALLLGLSIGGLLARCGASQADYYSDIIGLALQRKAYMAKKTRRRFRARHRIEDEGRTVE